MHAVCISLDATTEVGPPFLIDSVTGSGVKELMRKTKCSTVPLIKPSP